MYSREKLGFLSNDAHKHHVKNHQVVELFGNDTSHFEKFFDVRRRDVREQNESGDKELENLVIRQGKLATILLEALELGPVLLDNLVNAVALAQLKYHDGKFQDTLVRF
ncbi:MAG: hypothetical protein LBT40_02230 [Deltaproteobacteria bacterium]|jgi:hypothetical protein|nr:hypothetical protein [Deltaproteobacteria bacterium]